MTEPTCLIAFLEATGADVTIYDMGRRVVKIPNNEFLDFEKTIIPYPYPMQHQAWFGVCSIDKSVSSEPIIWFLNLPLDEQGKLVQASREYFMRRLMEVAIEKQQGKELTADAFKDNPYTFKPREQRMAVIHAKLARDLNSGKSRFFQHALDYFQGKPGWDQWSFVGYQGIADVAAHVNQSTISSTLTSAIAKLPDQPLSALCHCLENEPLPADVSSALLKRLKVALSIEAPSISLIADLIRALSHSQSGRMKGDMLDHIFASKVANNIEILVAISGRAWELLKKPEAAKSFMELLANNDHGQDAFNQCTADLMSIPGMRDSILSTMRDADRSEKLAESFSQMTQQWQKP